MGEMGADGTLFSIPPNNQTESKTDVGKFRSGTRVGTRNNKAKREREILAYVTITYSGNSSSFSPESKTIHPLFGVVRGGTEKGGCN